jgi:transcriptional antiterminator NusG
VVDQGLYKKNIESFLPKIKAKSKRKDRKVILNTPLFPGYLFVKTDLHPDEHLEILKTIGVVRLLGNKDGPVPVPQETIESLKIMISTDTDISTGNGMKRGDRVMVLRGAFTGVIGRFMEDKGQHRIVVHIEALGQFASVTISKEDVELLPEIFS